MFEACSVIPEHVSKNTRTRPEDRVLEIYMFMCCCFLFGSVVQYNNYLQSIFV